jgi:hypothetical protein
MECLVDGHNGIYVSQIFCQRLLAGAYPNARIKATRRDIEYLAKTEPYDLDDIDYQDIWYAVLDGVEFPYQRGYHAADYSDSGDLMLGTPEEWDAYNGVEELCVS